MTKMFAGLAAGFALVSVPLIAGEDTPDPDKLICKQEKKPNSRFTAKTCFTRAQWDEMSEQNKRSYSETRDRPTIDIRRDTGSIGGPR